MALTPSQKTVGRLAGSLGILQGLTWTALSLACIILYYVDDQKKTFEGYDYLNRLLYYFYLVNNKDKINWRTIRASDFIILMWIYFFISIVWTTVSIDLFLAVQFNKSRHVITKIVWGIVTLAISIIDFVFTSLILRDFVHCSTSNTNELVLCHAVIGTVMCLASRGFVLWIINFVLAFSEILFGIKIINHNQIMAARGDITIPRPKMDSSQAGSIDYNPRYPSFTPGNQAPPTQPINRGESRMY